MKPNTITSFFTTFVSLSDKIYCLDREGFGSRLWPNEINYWLRNFIKLFNFISSVGETDEIALRLVALVFFAPL